MDQEIEFKFCKTCNISKELKKYRPKSLQCNECINKKDYVKSLIRKKEHYKRNRERIIKHNTEYYFKQKLFKESNNEDVLCV